MSEKQKHTQALRWVAGQPDGATQTEIYGKAIYADMTGKVRDRRVVAYAVEDERYDSYWDEIMANAHLIAAAPDLLEAARYARALIEAGLALQVLDPVQRHAHPDGDFNLRWAEALEQLKAAIARAEGGAE